MSLAEEVEELTEKICETSSSFSDGSAVWRFIGHSATGWTKKLGPEIQGCEIVKTFGRTFDTPYFAGLS